MEVERHGGKRSIDHYVLGKTLGIGSFGESVCLCARACVRVRSVACTTVRSAQ